MKDRRFGFFSFRSALRKSIRRALAALTALAILPAAAQAQFETDRSYIGAHLGLGSYESSVSFGGDFEYGLTQPGEAGPGRIGIGGTLDYWSWSGDAGYDVAGALHGRLGWGVSVLSVGVNVTL